MSSLHVTTSYIQTFLLQTRKKFDISYYNESIFLLISLYFNIKIKALIVVVKELESLSI